MLKRLVARLIVLSVLSLVIGASLFAVPAQAITNGAPDGDKHPYVCLVGFTDGQNVWRTTGILLSEDTVLTAGHGTAGATQAWIWIDETIDSEELSERVYPVEAIYTHPGFTYNTKPGLTGFITHDVGIVKLAKPVPTGLVSPYGKLPTAGLVDTLPVKTDVIFVGYGVQYQITPRNNGGPYEAWRGVPNRFYASGELLAKSALSDEFIKCTSNPSQGKGGTAYGDSGGPVFLENTDTIVAITSFSTNSNCAGVGYYYRIDQQEILEWISTFIPQKSYE